MKSRWMTIALFAMTISVLIGVDNVNADRQYEYVEMADGAYVKFKVDPGAISALKSDDPTSRSSMKAAVNETGAWTKRVEMADGKHVEFPLSDMEIRRLKEREATVAAQRDMEMTDLLCQIEIGGVEVIEMGDGKLVVFASNKAALAIDPHLYASLGTIDC